MNQSTWIRFKKEALARGWRIQEWATEQSWCLTATLGLVVLEIEEPDLLRARELLLIRWRRFERRR